MILALILVSSMSWAATSKIEKCSAYLRSPVDLQSSTRVALRVRPSRLEVTAAEDRLRNYVETAPLESPEVLAYLMALRRDAPPAFRAPHVGSFGALANLYLMRDGNEDFANLRLEMFLENLWEDFLVYRRDSAGQARLESEVQFLERLHERYPGSVEAAWAIELPDYLREILSYNEINRNFQAAVSSLTSKTVKSWDQERLEYQKQIAAELKVAFVDSSVSEMMKLRVIRDPTFRGNETFALDSKLWSGGAVFEGESPVVALVFLTRLSRRLNLRTPLQVQFEALAQQLQK